MFITKWGSSGTEDGQFSHPTGVAVDSSGNVYVADSSNNRIQKFDSSGIFITKWGSSGIEDGQFGFPMGVAVDSSGNVYVADCGNYRIQKFDSSGIFITKWGSSGTEDRQFTYPTGVAVDSSGNVYVADYLNHCIQKFDNNGMFITKWGSYGTEDGQFSYPFGVAVDSSGNVYVVDYLNHRIQKFDNNGMFITKWGSYGTEDGQFSYPMGVAVDSSGNVYVADYSNYHIQKFAPTETLIPPAPIYNPENGHYYNVIFAPSITWEDAKDAAQSLSYSGMNGHLATITSPDENEFIITNIADDNCWWLGGYQPDDTSDSMEPDGNWHWVTEEKWDYTNWPIDRPDNAWSGQNCLALWSGKNWDDASIDDPSHIRGYIVEYEEQRLPVANFSTDVIKGNVPLSVQFTDLSEKATEWNWSFGDGNTSTEQNPTHTYSAAGIYTVNLTATNANGTDSKLATITVLEKSASIICKVVGTNYQYWSNEQYPIIDLFGEQEVPLLANNDPIWQPHVNKLAKLVLDNNKKYTLKNSEKLDLGQDYTLEVKQIDVDGKKVWLEFTKDGEFVDDQIVSTDAGSNTWTCELDKIQGEDNVPVLKVHVNQVFQSANDSIAQIDGLWLIDYANAKTLEVGDKFGEFTLAQIINGVDESNLGSLVFEFSSFEYPVYAYITNTDSNTVSIIDTTTNTVTATVNVGSYPFGVAVNPVGTKIYVPNEGSNDVSIIDTATNTVTATVKVGFGPHGAAVNPEGTKVYVTNYGDNNVSVIDTATNTVTATVNVGGNPQGVAVTPDGTKLYVVNYWDSTVSVIDTATNIVTATVPVGYDPNGVAVNPEGTKVYVTTSGDSTVSVIDTTTNTVTATVPVGRSPFGVAFTPDGKKVYVTNQNDGSVSVIDTATNNVIATVNVGSNPFGIAVNPEGTKIYVANGNSNNVSVIDSATNNVIATVNVGDNPIGFGQFIVPPSALTQVLHVTNFTANTTEGTTPLTVKFTDTSTNSPTRWKWNFGDDQTSTVQNPEHTFSGAGVYTVTLVVINGDGASGVKSMNITVNRVPTPSVANFIANKTEGIIPLTVRFTDTSTNHPTKWEWNFGDGNTSTEQNPVHTFSSEGTYNVTLVATNGDGSSGVKSMDIKVNRVLTPPVADFSASVTSGNAPLNVQFTDLSLYSTSRIWNFGDGNTSTDQNPTHTYYEVGNYTVTLKVSNIDGTSSKLSTVTVFVPVLPDQQNFSTNATNVSAPVNVQIGNLSQNATAINWNIGSQHLGINFSSNGQNVSAPVTVQIDNISQNATTINWNIYSV